RRSICGRRGFGCGCSAGGGEARLWTGRSQVDWGIAVGLGDRGRTRRSQFTRGAEVVEQTAGRGGKGRTPGGLLYDFITCYWLSGLARFSKRTGAGLLRR